MRRRWEREGGGEGGEVEKEKEEEDEEGFFLWSTRFLLMSMGGAWRPGSAAFGLSTFGGRGQMVKGQVRRSGVMGKGVRNIECSSLSNGVWGNVLCAPWARLQPRISP